MAEGGVGAARAAVSAAAFSRPPVPHHPQDDRGDDQEQDARHQDIAEILGEILQHGSRLLALLDRWSKDRKEEKREKRWSRRGTALVPSLPDGVVSFT